MDPPTHIIDPDGEVIIVLRNSNAPFAEPGEDMPVNGFSHSDDTQIPAEEIEPPEPIEQNCMAGSNIKKKKRKDRKKKSSSLSTTAHLTPEPIQDPVPEPLPEPVPYTTEEHVPEEPPSKEPGAEENLVEGPAEKQSEEQTEINLEEESCFRIQVSAKHLILASPVLKKILTGGWKESVTFLKERSVEITAEGWDIEALLILLRAIHGQHYDIPRKLTLEMLAKIAVLVDYYDCKESVFIWTTIWIKNLDEKIPDTYSRDLILWLLVSWVFQLPAQFRQTTSTVLSGGTSWFNNLGLPIPAKAIEAIDKQRQENIDSLVGLLHDKRGELLTGIGGCCFEWSSIMYGALTKEMHSIDLLSPRPTAPFVGWSYQSLVRKIQSFRELRWRSRYSYDDHYCSDSSFAKIFGTLNTVVQGLELHELL